VHDDLMASGLDVNDQTTVEQPVIDVGPIEGVIAVPLVVSITRMQMPDDRRLELLDRGGPALMVGGRRSGPSKLSEPTRVRRANKTDRGG
jgi:hypothetical protein